MRKFSILILRYTKIDLSVFDFNDFDIKILDVESDEFDEYIKKLNPDFYNANKSLLTIVREDIYTERDKKYAIIKNKPLESFEIDNLYKVYDILLTLFPSALQIQYSFDFKENEGFIQRQKLVTLTDKYHPEERYLDIDNLSPSKVSNLKKLIKIIHPRLDFSNYIGLCYVNYYNSFTASHLHFSFITLCMSLENLVSGPQELSYRLKRASSILAGDNIENCKILFKNLTNIYNLRSKIVHGESFNPSSLIPKIDYLRGLISRIIVELLLHNIKTNKDLGDAITVLGYGQRDQLSTGWEFYELNDINTKKIYDDA